MVSRVVFRLLRVARTRGSEGRILVGGMVVVVEKVVDWGCGLDGGEEVVD